MPDIPHILSIHRQLYTDSCAAAGMELILKLHEKVPPHWFNFQIRIENTNIGFEQLGLLKQYGITASDAHLPKNELIALLTSETRAGRFPLVALPGYWSHNLSTGQHGFDRFHIWTAIPQGQSFQLVSGGDEKSSPVLLPPLDLVMSQIHHYDSNYLFHYVRYAI